MPLPPLPELELTTVEDLAAVASSSGFLLLRRSKLQIAFEGRSRSTPFSYDYVHREALDAVVVAPHFKRDGERWVFLRTAIRPPLKLRPANCRPLPEKPSLGFVWELPAGLVEPSECAQGAAGLRLSAVRELAEELGAHVEPAALQPLGAASCPSAGVIGERHHFFHVAVDPNQLKTPDEDGSPLEEHALIASLSLREAIALCRSGVIEDAKTEIALRRLHELEEEA
jgi:ADP-ribose pyrophosphatase